MDSGVPSLGRRQDLPGLTVYVMDGVVRSTGSAAEQPEMAETQGGELDVVA